MNQFMKNQCQTMLLSCKTFMDGVRLAALKDDGIVSKEESKMLSALEKVTTSYEKEIKKIMEKYK